LQYILSFRINSFILSLKAFHLSEKATKQLKRNFDFFQLVVGAAKSIEGEE